MVKKSNRKIDDREFRIILPKYDNAEKKIKAGVLKKVIDEMNLHFKGSTIYPSVLGCWTNPSNKDLICEENIIVTSVRDNEHEAVKEELKRRGISFKQMLDEDEKFMQSLSKKTGFKLGQGEVFTGTSTTEVDMLKGKFKEELPKSKTGADFFRKYI